MKQLQWLSLLGLGPLLLHAATAALGQDRPPEGCELKNEISSQNKFGSSQRIMAGPEWFGTLRADDQRERVRGTPCNVCLVDLVEGTTYFIDMKRYGQKIDSYLMLEDKDRRHLDSDDDSGGKLQYGGEGETAKEIPGYYGRKLTYKQTYSGAGQDARITYRCAATGTYRIIATTYDGMTGAYRLQVTKQEDEDKYNQFIFEATRYAKDKALRDYCKAVENYSKALGIRKSVNLFRARAWVYTNMKAFEKARKDDTCAIYLNQKDGYSWYCRGIDYQDLHDYKNALGDFYEAMQHAADPRYFNDAAWILATALDDTVRDGKHAVALAKRAFDLGAEAEYDNPAAAAVAQGNYAATLAAAYAEQRNFEEALRYQELALRINPQMDGAQDRLNLYRMKRPFRQ